LSTIYVLILKILALPTHHSTYPLRPCCKGDFCTAQQFLSKFAVFLRLQSANLGQKRNRDAVKHLIYTLDHHAINHEIATLSMSCYFGTLELKLA
jgi:hypothetical protein